MTECVLVEGGGTARGMQGIIGVLTCWGLWCLLRPSRSDGRRPASDDSLVLHAGTGTQGGRSPAGQPLGQASHAGHWVQVQSRQKGCCRPASHAG